MKKCPDCLRPNDDDAAFCEKCGGKFPEKKEIKSGISSPITAIKGKILIVVGILIVAMFVIIYSFENQKKNTGLKTTKQRIPDLNYEWETGKSYNLKNFNDKCYPEGYENIQWFKNIGGIESDEFYIGRDGYNVLKMTGFHR